MITDWSKYPDFSEAEMACKHTGLCHMDERFMTKLQQLRTAYGKPLIVTSGYRHPTHPIEAAKLSKTAGEHTLGTCADIACPTGVARYHLIGLAMQYGFSRIGIAKDFLHLGIGAVGSGLPQYVVWLY